MRKIDIAKTIAVQSGLTLAESIRQVDLVFQVIIDTLRRGEEVMIARFGKFRVRTKQARRGRNPRTGETIPITPRRVVQFRASLLLKQAVARQGRPLPGEREPATTGHSPSDTPPAQPAHRHPERSPQ